MNGITIPLSLSLSLQMIKRVQLVLMTVMVMVLRMRMTTIHATRISTKLISGNTQSLHLILRENNKLILTGSLMMM